MPLSGISEFLRRRTRRHAVLAALALPIAVALLATGTVGAQAAARPVGAGVATGAATGAVQPVAGHGSATARTASFQPAAAKPLVTAAPLTPAQRAQLNRAVAAGQSPVMATRPTTTRSGQALAPRALGPLTSVTNNFDGLNQSQGCPSGCYPPDPNVAAGANELIETVNTQLDVYAKNGNGECWFNGGYNGFFGTSDFLSDPRVMYDNVSGRYFGVITDVSAEPSLWVFATQTTSPCGSWWFWHLSFSGGSFPSGTLMDYPILGQDRLAMLVSTNNFTPTSENYTVFPIQKSVLYSGGSISVTAYSTVSPTAPVTNSGTPMISTPYSYFLGADPATGFRLYRMNSGGNPPLVLQATISAPFTAPPSACQPGTTAVVDTIDGRIQWSPAYDGTNIWFAHTINDVGYPTVVYGTVNTATNALSTGYAYHSGTSEDFNPSIGISAASGGTKVFLNWAYTDIGSTSCTATSTGTHISDVVDSDIVPTGAAPPYRSGTVAVTGINDLQYSSAPLTRFGDFSSVSIDPTSSGTCAWTAQQYFPSSLNGIWDTRMAEVC